MKCPGCEYENPGDIKFCGNCGTKLEKLCSNCNSGNPPQFNFCGECGNKLDAVDVSFLKDFSIDEKIANIQKYLPKGLADKILSQKDRIEGERKQVTVMFCDMAGYSTLSEKLDPEQTYNIIDQVYEILIHKVHDYEGTVNELTGDGIMALFGAPIALEDAPQRAIRSSMAIHRAMADFSDRLKHELKNTPQIKMRIGLHTGPVVVGPVGNDLRVEFKAVGDTVNLASRMEGLAEPGSTYLTEATFRLAEGIFRFEAVGIKEVKGRQEHVKVYRAIAPSTSRTRFDVSTERGLTPFIGRERELELLLDGFGRSKTGRGQAVSIIADAGVGKSRLLYEFRKSVANENVTFLEGKCLAYSRSLVYHPIIDILKANFDIRIEDKEKQIRKKIKEGLKLLGVEESSTLPYFLDLFSIKDSAIEKIPLSPEARKNRTFDALKKIVLKGSLIRPLIMAFENLHWIDKSSEKFLIRLLETISAANVFLIFTYRPEYIHTWGGKSYHSHVNLNRLSNRETLKMVSCQLDGMEFNEQTEAMILEKTEGVPFFIEELINSLKDQKIICKKGDRFCLTRNIQETVIPSTIQDVIMARIDSLNEGAKNLIQTSSVAGREFSYNLLEKIVDTQKDELLTNLSVLKDSELLYERGIYPQSDYVFKHVLTQEVAYHSLLLKRRIMLHAMIGKELESIYANRLDEFCEILAYHFTKGQEWKRAYEYNQKAGLKAYSHSDYEQALQYFEEALTTIRNLPRENNRIKKEVDLCFNMRSPLVALGRHEQWGEWIRSAEPLAKEINDNTRLSKIANYLSSLHWIHGEHRSAIVLGKEALDYANRSGHFSCQIATMLHLGLYYYNIGSYFEQIQIHEDLREQLKGEDVYKLHGLASLPGAFSRSLIVAGMAELGKFGNIEIIGNEAIDIAEKVQNALTLTFVYNFVAMAYLRLGKLKSAIPLLEKSHELCRSSELQSMYAFTIGNLGRAYLLAKEFDRALALLEEGAKEENIQASFWSTHPLIVLADAYRLVGELSLALETISLALQMTNQRDERGFEAWAMLTMAMVMSAQEKHDESKKWYLRTLQQATNLSMQPLVAHCHAGLADVNMHIGDKNASELEKSKSIKLYQDLGMDFWLSY